MNKMYQPHTPTTPLPGSVTAIILLPQKLLLPLELFGYKRWFSVPESLSLYSCHPCSPPADINQHLLTYFQNIASNTQLCSKPQHFLCPWLLPVWEGTLQILSLSNGIEFLCSWSKILLFQFKKRPSNLSSCIWVLLILFFFPEWYLQIMIK